ncbi:unnamed protein product [Calypogeia fissa]
MNGRDPARNLAMRSSSRAGIVVRVGIIPIMSVMAIVHNIAGTAFSLNMVWLFVFNALFNLELYERDISAVELADTGASKVARGGRFRSYHKRSESRVEQAMGMIEKESCAGLWSGGSQDWQREVQVNRDLPKTFIG